MKRGKDGQARRSRQPQARQLLRICLKLIEKLLILRTFTNFIEKNFHMMRIPALGNHQSHPYNSIDPLYLFIAAFNPLFTNSRAASAARSTTSERTFISSREKF